MLKKPFVITLLLFVISSIVGNVFYKCFEILQIQHSIWALPIPWALTAACLGIIYTSIYKIKLSQKDKIKIVFYYLFISTALFSASVILLKLINVKIILPLLLIIISAFFIYVSLELGCKIKLKLLKKDNN